MTQLLQGPQALKHVRICKLSFDGRTRRTVREINSKESETLQMISRELNYTPVRHKERASCTVGETKFIVTLLTEDDSEMKVEVCNNSMYVGDELLGIVEKTLLTLLNQEVSQSRTETINPALVLLRATG